MPAATPSGDTRPIELFELLVLADLRRRGFSVPQLHQIIATLRGQFGARLFEATGGGGHVQLLTDGHDIYARTDRGEFFNLLREPAQPLLVVGDEGLLKELSSTLRPRRPRRSQKGALPAPRKRSAGKSRDQKRDAGRLKKASRTLAAGSSGSPGWCFTE